MPKLKKYIKKVDYIEAYQIPSTGTRQSVQVNESGFYDVLYHGSDMTPATIGWIQPGDYLVKQPNGMWKAVLQKDFEAMYELIEEEEEKPSVSMETFRETIQEIKSDTEKTEVKKESPQNEYGDKGKPISASSEIRRKNAEDDAIAASKSSKKKQIYKE